MFKINKEGVSVDTKIQKTIQALQNNRMNAFYVETKEEALKLALGFIKEGDVISHGGSVTLKEVGLIDAFKNGKYKYLDRSAPGLTNEEIMEIYRKCFGADAYFTSSNAVTVSGELYNVDGNSNRVAPMLFGPEKVIVVVGVNKIVDTISDAADRVKRHAAPPNCVRLEKNTYCAKEGKCVTADSGELPFCAGCGSDDRICSNFTVMTRQRQEGRVNVIIVNEKLGY